MIRAYDLGLKESRADPAIRLTEPFLIKSLLLVIMIVFLGDYS
jgi:hypothetical protein